MSFRLKIIISIISVTIIILAIIMLVIIPTINDIRTISAAIFQERVDLEEKYLRGQLLKKTVSDFEKIKPQKDVLDSIFIHESDELAFISTLEDLSTENGVQQTLNLETRNIRENKGIKYFPLKITVEGSFVQVMNYLSGLENLKYYFNISSINLSADRTEIIANLEGTVFSKPKGLES